MNVRRLFALVSAFTALTVTIARGAPTPHYVPVLGVGDLVPSVRLRDQRNQSVSWDAWRGSTLIVSFIYTRCRDAAMCPLVSAKFARMQRILRNTPIHLVEVTLDPAHDVPRVLQRYGAEFGVDSARWSLVTGDVRAMHDLAERFGFTADGDPDVALRHWEGVVIVGADGHIADRIDGNSWSAAEIVAQARSRAALWSNPFARLQLALGQGVGALCSIGSSGISLGLALAIFGILLCVGTVIACRAFRDVIKPQ